MASSCSFDVVSNIDMQEVKNAINQSTMEISKRYDFKGSKSSIELDEKNNVITVISDDSFKMKAVIDILQSKFIKRNVPIENLDYGTEEESGGNTVRKQITLKQGISKEDAKKIIKKIKDLKVKVQPSIQEDQIRVTGKNKDDLQEVISFLKQNDFKMALQFVNYR